MGQALLLPGAELWPKQVAGPRRKQALVLLLKLGLVPRAVVQPREGPRHSGSLHQHLGPPLRRGLPVLVKLRLMVLLRLVLPPGVGLVEAGVRQEVHKSFLPVITAI